MKGPITTLVIGLAFLATHLAAQPTFTVSPQNITANAGDDITVDIIVSNFNDIVSFQYSMSWNPAVLQFTSLSNLSSQLGGFTQANFGTNNAGSGILTASWLDPDVAGVTLPDSSVLYSINFHVLTTTQTTIAFANAPTSIEVTIPGGTNVGLIPQNATVNSGGGGGGGGGGNPPVQGFAVIASNETVPSGQQFCVDISVNEFTNINSMQYTMEFDETKLTFQNISGFNLNGLTVANFGTNQASQGILTFSWVDPEVNGETLADGTVIYQVCFTASGPNNCSTPTLFQFTNSPTVQEVTNVGGSMVPFQGIEGEIFICNTIPSALKFIGSQVTGAQGDTVCVDVSVVNFTDIVSAQFSMHFNQSIVQFVGIQGFGLPDLNLACCFGTTDVANGNLTLSWLDPSTNGVTVADSTVIFQVCFKVLGTLGQMTNFTFNGTPTVVEVTGVGSTQITPTFVNGKITVGNACPGPVSISNTITHVKCKGGSTGAIDITPSGGNNSYTYVWKNAGGTTIASTQDVNNLAAGTYSVTVTSCGGSQTKTQSFTVNEPLTEISFEVDTVINVACFGQSTGGIQITASGGTLSPPSCSAYTYNWSNGATTQDIANIPTGGYKVTITDCNACQLVSDSIFVAGPPSAFIVTPSAFPVKCFGGNDGTVVFVTSGGVGPYKFNVDGSGFQSGNTFGGLSAGNHNWQGCDAFGCVVSGTITINSPSDITVSLSATNATGNNCDGSIQTTVTGGSPFIVNPPTYNYKWAGPNNFMSTDKNPSGLCPGNYCLTVTDANGCTEVKCTVVSAPLVVTATKKNACMGACDGCITLDVVGGIQPLQYNWSNSGNTPTICNLCAGSYSVTVTSPADNQVQTLTVNISEATSIPDVTATVADPTSSTICNGSVTITNTTGGFGQPYSYNWSNGDIGLISDSLCDENTYLVTITDGNGCTGTHSYFLDFNPLPIEFGINSTQSCPNNSSGSLTIAPTGGTPPFNIAIAGPANQTQNGVQNQAVFNNLPPGDYNVTMTDAAGGSDQQDTTFIASVDAVVISIHQDQIFSETSTQLGKIKITTSGGAIPYHYQWSNGSTAEDPSGLQQDCYDVTVCDNNGCCEVFTDICVGLFTATGDINRPNCLEDTDGTITVSATGSVNGPFTYSWKKNGVTVDNDAVLDNQLPGIYTLIITDTLGVSIAYTFEMNPLSNLTATADAISNFNGYDVRCNGGKSGKAAVVAENGVPQYTYLWSNGKTTPTIDSLTAGTYTVSVTDAEGCTISKTINVTQPDKLMIETEGDRNGCVENGGVATANASGGVPSYSYKWNDAQSGPTAILLKGGNYLVTVTDMNGCTAVGSADVPAYQPLELTGLSDPDEGGPDGSACVVVNSGTWPFEYDWNNFPDKDSCLSELLPGKYLVKVADAAGCEALIFITVDDATNCLEFLPVITPEGDGNLEEFVIGCLSRYSDNHLEIYNRWGQMVYKTDNYHDGDLWRGTNNRGDELPDGVYFYVFEYLDPVSNLRYTEKGSVSVLRK